MSAIPQTSQPLLPRCCGVHSGFSVQAMDSSTRPAASSIVKATGQLPARPALPAVLASLTMARLPSTCGMVELSSSTMSKSILDKVRHWSPTKVDFVREVAQRTRDAVERRRAEDQQRLLANELQHRVKNTLAMIQAIAAQTFKMRQRPKRRAPSPTGWWRWPMPMMS